MRILIIAHSRSGSQILNRWLGVELCYRTVYELFNTNPKFKNRYNRGYFSIEFDNIVDKEIIVDMPETYVNQNWDKVLRLIREDTKESAISLTKSQETTEYQKQYNIDNVWLDDNKEKIKINIEFIDQCKCKIKNINVGKLITYESIYCDDNKEFLDMIKDYLGLDITWKHTYLLDTNRRYRKNENIDDNWSALR